MADDLYGSLGVGSNANNDNRPSGLRSLANNRPRVEQNIYNIDTRLPRRNLPRRNLPSLPRNVHGERIFPPLPATPHGASENIYSEPGGTNALQNTTRRNAPRIISGHGRGPYGADMTDIPYIDDDIGDDRLNRSASGRNSRTTGRAGGTTRGQATASAPPLDDYDNTEVKRPVHSAPPSPLADSDRGGIDRPVHTTTGQGGFDRPGHTTTGQGGIHRPGHTTTGQGGIGRRGHTTTGQGGIGSPEQTADRTQRLQNLIIEGDGGDKQAYDTCSKGWFKKYRGRIICGTTIAAVVIGTAIGLLVYYKDDL